MRVVFLSQLLPLPLDAGPKIRAYYVLRYLVSAGHDVTLVCFSRDSDRDCDVKALRRLCSSVETVPLVRSRLQDLKHGLGSAISNVPFLIRRDQFREMDERLSKVLARHSVDALHADQLWMAPYAAKCADVPFKVLDQHNAVFKVPQRLAEGCRNRLVRSALMLEATRLAKFEQSMFEHFNRVVWVTEEDRKAFPEPSMQDKTEHHVIPIAVDTATRLPMTRTNPFRVTFLGGVHWPPNAEGVRWFLKDVWPAVLRAVPNTVFTVIGKGSLGRHGHQEPGVEVTGYVPDPTELLEETVVFVVPLLTGAGMRVKILDAWSWALPVVSTTIGAEGIRSLHGENILISDDPAEFTDSLVRVLRSSELASRLSAGGRATVESHYDWRAVYQAWDRVYG